MTCESADLGVRLEKRQRLIESYKKQAMYLEYKKVCGQMIHKHPGTWYQQRGYGKGKSIDGAQPSRLPMKGTLNTSDLISNLMRKPSYDF